MKPQRNTNNLHNYIDKSILNECIVDIKIYLNLSNDRIDYVVNYIKFNNTQMMLRKI